MMTKFLYTSLHEVSQQKSVASFARNCEEKTLLSTLRFITRYYLKYSSTLQSNRAHFNVMAIARRRLVCTFLDF